MKATEAKLLDFLKKSPQFVIPIYQRTYSWSEQQCRQLWDDIMRAGTNDGISAHFIGSVVYIEKGLYQVSSQSPLLVIDGQQRLTTTMLILEALSRHLGNTETLEGFSAKKLRNYYLLNPLEDGERAYKLLLTQTDKESLLALVTQKPLPDDGSLRIQENFEFFNSQIERLNGELETLCRGLSKLIIVDIALSRDQDNPQLIFESMNSTGKALSQADLIRNYVLMGLEPEHQNSALSRPLASDGGGIRARRLWRFTLTASCVTTSRLKTGEIPRLDEVYEAFKQHSRRAEVASAGVDSLVAEIHAFARYFLCDGIGERNR